MTETGWLIELPLTAKIGGQLHYVALSQGDWPKYADLPVWRRGRDRLEEYITPVEYTPDSNKALRFARKQDAEEFMSKFQRFIIHGAVTEHIWHGGPA